MPPLPNLMLQRPSITIGLLSGERTLFTNAPVLGSYALIRPSPKLPIQRVPPRSPKPLGVITMPQGAFKPAVLDEAPEPAAVNIERIHDPATLAESVAWVWYGVG